MNGGYDGNTHTMREFGTILKVLTILASLIGFLYLVYIGSIFYDLWFTPNPTGCGTPHVWGLMGSGILFAPIGLVLGSLQLWIKEKTKVPPEWGRLCLTNAIFLLSLAALGITFFIPILF